MSELTRLRTRLNGLAGDVAQMQKPVNRAHLTTRLAKAALAKPRQLSRVMKGLISKADTLSKSATVLAPFPVIGTLAGRIARILRKVKSTAVKVKRTADRLDQRSKPAQKAVQRVAPPVNKAKLSLDRAQALLQGWLAIVKELERRSGAQPPAQVETACARMNASLAPEIDRIARGAPALAKNLDALSDALEGAASACRPIDPALDDANDVARRLRPLHGPLTELRRALRPVSWALDAVGWVARKVIDPIVNEILKAVGLKRLVDRLERALNPFARHLAPLNRIGAQLARSVKAIGDTGRITRPLERIPALEKQIAASMRPLKTLQATSSSRRKRAA